MVRYIPPLSPVAAVVHVAGYDDNDPDRVFAIAPHEPGTSGRRWRSIGSRY
ncbi:hypothetical protein ACWDUL_34995 [Nocardia niigatensis]|uniref:hypothetical protein n=1 Tax=Nocardia niigatensis TaxID=209249 RepID=UPI0002E4BF16|nr:hypothetical protein [Nocardia niigatensis]